MPEKSEFPSFLPGRMVIELIWNQGTFFLTRYGPGCRMNY